MISRRDFLKKCGQAVVTIGGGATLDAFLGGCAPISSVEKVPVIYPPLGGHKVQPPEDGCYIGFHRDYWNPFDESMVKKIGGTPKIMVISADMAVNPTSFPQRAVTYVTSKDAIPFVHRDLGIDIFLHGFKTLVDNKEFRRGMKKYAKELVIFGKPIFVSTMGELNGDWFPWGKKSETAKKVWQLMWQIFEDNGANEYATWVWEVYTPAAGNRKIDPAQNYYPGDAYVDWIGLSAYAGTRFVSFGQSFSDMVAETYLDMRKDCPEKPIMQAAFGKTKHKRKLDG